MAITSFSFAQKVFVYQGYQLTMNNISYLPPLSILIMSSCSFSFHLSSMHILHACIVKTYMMLHWSIIFNFVILYMEKAAF